MNNIEISLISLYVAFIISTYLIFLKRLKTLNDKHIEHTGIEGLRCSFVRLRRVITPIFIVLLGVGIFIIITLL